MSTIAKQNIQTVKIPFGNQSLEIETGRMAKQASGSVLVKLGEAAILVTCAVEPTAKDEQDFFPLTVDYREKTYAAGKIPGGFFKREARPRENETLTSRLIDRSIRPLFPEGFKNKVQVTAMVVSADQVNDTDIPSIIGASLALSISSIPFGGPIAAVRVGMVNDQFIANPNYEEQKASSLNLIVSGSKKGLLMVECGSTELSEERMIEALEFARKAIESACIAQEELVKSAGKEKMKFEVKEPDAELVKAVDSASRAKIKDAVSTPEKSQRENAMSELKREITASLLEKFPEKESDISAVIENVLYEEARDLIISKKVRTDGRKFDQIRPITSEIDVLPRTHGSALFTRGQTQSLVTVTLGTSDDMQIMDVLSGEYKERFMLHYNFPGFATGEPRGERSPGRREIGHGALARRSILPLLPNEEDFPYTIRIVSEILESNGSSSMASVCGGSLALFDAGVPMKSPCAGIAMGLVIEKGQTAILSDIIGLEDHLGDMDFKVAGTKNGITALQMDIKIESVTVELLKNALAQAKAGRLHILGEMEKAITTPKVDLSAYAPKMKVIQIPVEKIGGLIGPGGKNIKKIIEESGAQVNVEDSGKVFVSGVDPVAVQKAKEMVESTVAEVEVGKTYKGKVTRLMTFGCFVEVLRGKEGLVHISQLDTKRVEKVEDVCKEGDPMEVKCVEIDSQGRVNLSRKALLMPEGEYVYEPSRPPKRNSGPRRAKSFR